MLAKWDGIRARRSRRRRGESGGAWTVAVLLIAALLVIESRPAAERWNYRFFVDLVHPVGEAGLGQVIEPPPATMTNLHVLGSYRAAE